MKGSTHAIVAAGREMAAGARWAARREEEAIRDGAAFV
jgi:hypothetical protein